MGVDEPMNAKWVGAVCIVLGCGGWGFGIAAQHLRKIRLLRQLLSALDYMQCELQYRCTPLPQLCRQAGERESGKIGAVLLLFAAALEVQTDGDVKRCMAAALSGVQDLPECVRNILVCLGENMGNFDLEGQLKALSQVRYQCSDQLQVLLRNKDGRIRSYQTLGLCAGAAIAILLV